MCAAVGRTDALEIGICKIRTHFGIGNIFRIFIGGIADGLLESGALDRGITCVETFDYDVVDKIYAPFDNLGLSVILHRDGRREYKVLGSMAEANKAFAHYRW